MTLPEVNQMDRGAFVERVGWVFEHSPWVAERAWTARPFTSVDHLLTAMTSEVAAASADEQLALLRAHPDLGSRLRMSEASVDEQRGAGLDALSADDHQRVTALNDAYRARFGFPFLLAVRGCTKDDVLAALSARVGSTLADEFAEALRQVGRIAGFRLNDLFKEQR